MAPTAINEPLRSTYNSVICQAAYVGIWPTASFRCAAELGRYRGHSELPMSMTPL